MKNILYNKLNIIAILGLGFALLTGCDRENSEDIELAGFPTNGDVFIDGFSSGLEYLPFGGSKLNAFTVDDQTFFDGAASMRFDIPNVGDPDGAFAGAVFPDNGGRDLSGFDALTFWAKSSKSATINEIGFGNNFGVNSYLVTKNNLRLTTNWVKYVIPIPDPSKLTEERGMFWYSEGPEDDNGYTFWIDELKFEKLGTIAQPRPAIVNGEEKVDQVFIGANTRIIGTQTFNLADGTNETVTAAPSYFSFQSSNEAVASVNALGEVSILSTGEAEITAILGGVKADGSLTIQSLGDFVAAPVPTRDAANVISVFSDAYSNVPVDFFNGFFQEFQNTLGGADLEINGDNVIRYTELNFVATEFKNPTVNASDMTHLHIDIQVENPINSEDFLTIQLGDFGPDSAFGGDNDSNGSVTFTSDALSTRTWISLDIPLADFGLTSRANLAQLFFITDGSAPDRPGTITDLLVDNIYFYR